jgi:hypothetical protein
MSLIIRCACCAQLNRWPASATSTTSVRCAKCKNLLARPLSMGGGFADAFVDDDRDLDDADDDDNDDNDDDNDDDDDDDGGAL